MMLQKLYVFSRNHILNFEFLMFSGLTSCTILSYEVGQHRVTASNQPHDPESKQLILYRVAVNVFSTYDIFNLRQVYWDVSSL